MDWKRAGRLLLWAAVIGCMPTMIAVNHFEGDPLRLALLSMILLWTIGLYRIEAKLRVMRLAQEAIEAKLDEIIKTLPRYDEIADLESMTIPEIEGLEDKDEN